MPFRSPFPAPRPRRMRWMTLLLLTFCCVLWNTAPPGLARDSFFPDDAPTYDIFISDDGAEPLLFRLHVPPGDAPATLFFETDGGRSGRSDQLLTVAAVDADGRAVPLQRTAEGFELPEEGRPVEILYELVGHASIVKPETWLNNDPGALRWDAFASITNHALLRLDGERPEGVGIRLHLPAGWSVYGVGAVAPVEENVFFWSPEAGGFAIVAGRDVKTAQAGGVRLLTVGVMPLDEADLAPSLAAMLEPLRTRGLLSDERYEFILVRYPGALRFNPFIGSRLVGEKAFMQWLGVAGEDWWRKHTAADIVGSRVARTLALAPEARWFGAGLTDFGALLTLYEAGLLDADDLYQSLRVMFATAGRYAGPSWPSLAMAGLSEHRSHEADRVLQFRSPVAAFLFDLELRERSGGQTNLLDWWAALAEQQTQHPDQVLYNVDLFPPIASFGDMSAFAREQLFVSSRPVFDLDDLFDRWLALDQR